MAASLVELSLAHLPSSPSIPSLIHPVPDRQAEARVRRHRALRPNPDVGHRTVEARSVRDWRVAPGRAAVVGEVDIVDRAGRTGVCEGERRARFAVLEKHRRTTAGQAVHEQR